MDKMKLIYSLCAGIFTISLVITLTWSPASTWSRWLGFLFLSSSIFATYHFYKKEIKISSSYNQISPIRASLGLILIITDILYNVIMKNTFSYFDYGVIIAGLSIILLNINGLSFLKLDEKMIIFASYFIFITLILYGFSFKGLNIIFNSTNADNPFWNWFCADVAHATMLILNFIRPTTSYGSTINFDGFCVNVAYACSGLESISVFFSAILAYFISIREYNIRQIAKYLLIGILILYPINLMRIVTIVLVGYYCGAYEMLLVHSYLGMMIFVLSMTAFWYIVLKNNKTYTETKSISLNRL